MNSLLVTFEFNIFLDMFLSYLLNFGLVYAGLLMFRRIAGI